MLRALCYRICPPTPSPAPGQLGTSTPIYRLPPPGPSSLWPRSTQPLDLTFISHLGGPQGPQSALQSQVCLCPFLLPPPPPPNRAASTAFCPSSYGSCEPTDPKPRSSVPHLHRDTTQCRAGARGCSQPRIPPAPYHPPSPPHGHHIAVGTQGGEWGCTEPPLRPPLEVGPPPSLSHVSPRRAPGGLLLHAVGSQNSTRVPFTI